MVSLNLVQSSSPRAALYGLGIAIPGIKQLVQGKGKSYMSIMIRTEKLLLFLALVMAMSVRTLQGVLMSVLM